MQSTCPVYAADRRPWSAGRARGAVPVLGIDVGSTNVKAALVVVDGAVGTVTQTAVRSSPTPAHPDALVRAVLDLVRSILADGPSPQAVGIASMAETGAPLGADGRALTDLLRWDGSRGAVDADRLADELGPGNVFAATGVRPSPKVPLVTWAWLRRTEPAVWRRMSRWAGAADLVCLALTGRLVTDHTLAGRTMAYRLPPAGQPLPASFDEDLLHVVGLRTEQLPDVAVPGRPAGAVVRGPFVDAGLPMGTPVVVAGHDHPVGAWAAGMREPGDRSDSVGTAEAVMTVLGTPADRGAVAAQGMSLVRTVGGIHEAVLAGSPSAGAMVQWWRENVLDGADVGRALAAAVPQGPSGLLVLPYLHGRQAPYPDPAARLRVIDESGADIPVDSIRAAAGDGVPAVTARCTEALFEGLAFQARWMLLEQGRVATRTTRTAERPAPAQAPQSPVSVLGGAAGANTFWMALKAAVSDCPVRLVTSAEPVATGAALLAADRLGLVPTDAVRLPDRAVEQPPDPGHRSYDRSFYRFVAAATGGGAGPVTARTPARPPTSGES